jgi:hypothetical protein
VVGRVGAVLVIVIGTLIAGVGETGVRAQSGPQLHYSAIYFPWVANGDEIDGVGPWYGSITVQNVATAEHPERNVMLFALDERWIWSIAYDVTLTLEAGVGDVTTRDNQGWRATASPRRCARPPTWPHPATTSRSSTRATSTACSLHDLSTAEPRGCLNRRCCFLRSPPMVERVPSMEFLLELVQTERDKQLDHLDALDGKAGIILGSPAC